jgi:hypothetical protein
VKHLQRGATTPSRAQRGGCGGSLEDLLCPDGFGQTKLKLMWRALKNVGSGTVHAVALPSGMSPYGFAMDWGLVETDDPLTCQLCLMFAYQYRRANPVLNAMLPADLRCSGESTRLQAEK